MIRQKFLITLTLAVTLTTAGQSSAQAADPVQIAPKGERPLNIAQFDDAVKSISPARVAELDAALRTASVPQIQTLFQQNLLTTEELVKYYLWRIEHYDLNKLNSVTELNSDALEIARQLDTERATSDVRGPLHGTAVLLKDIIGTGDGLHNTAGALALRDAKSDRDAFLVKRLRDAGVVVLGKAALTEWSNFIAFKQIDGYSTLGGQVKNPYNKDISPFGSSNGSAVATAANLATFALGAETAGSLILPAVANSAAAFKPSMGMVSRDRIIPQLDSQDMPGPMARNVTDLALVMDVISATDSNDPVTTTASTAQKGFAKTLDTSAMRGLRVGLLPAYTPEDDAINKQMIDTLKRAGAQVIALPRQPDLYPDIFAELDPVTAYAAKAGIEKYLAETKAPIRTLKDIVAFNAQDPAKRVRYGQEYLEMAADSTMSSTKYITQTLAIGDKARKEIDGLMTGNELDLIAGTHFAVPFTINYPSAGYPALAIQAGYRDNGEPVGFVLVGKSLDDAMLIHAGYVLEQATKAWQPPNLAKWK